jgi:hypothetical protein
MSNQNSERKDRVSSFFSSFFNSASDEGVPALSPISDPADQAGVVNYLVQEVDKLREEGLTQAAQILSLFVSVMKAHIEQEGVDLTIRCTQIEELAEAAYSSFKQFPARADEESWFFKNKMEQPADILDNIVRQTSLFLGHESQIQNRQ